MKKKILVFIPFIVVVFGLEYFASSYFIDIEEFLYFNYQALKIERKSDIHLYSTMESHGDSLVNFLRSNHANKGFYLINLPMKHKAKNMVLNNIIYSYGLIDDLNYLKYNIYLESISQLDTLARVFDIKRYGTNPFLNFYGNQNSFKLHYLDSFDSLLSIKEGDIAIVGYGGESFDPIFDNDSTEVWFTPKLEMYDLVLKGNLIENLKGNDFAYRSGLLSSVFVAISLLISIYLFLSRMSQVNKKMYFRFKVFQILVIAFSMLICVLVFNLNTIIPIGGTVLSVIILGEFIYWILSKENSSELLQK